MAICNEIIVDDMIRVSTKEDIMQEVRESYDRLAQKYTSRSSNEVQPKPLDQELLTRFADDI